MNCENFIVDKIQKSTNDYMEAFPKSKRKDIGQFFTPASIANFMSELFVPSGECISVLDPGAGAGILSGAICNKILKISSIKEVSLDLYENNEAILPVLKSNMDMIAEVFSNANKKFSYRIINKNFIIDNASEWLEDLLYKGVQYDIVISNPPYKKLNKDSNESVTMKSIVFGQPNIYYLFMAMATKLLKDDGQLIFITPRSFCTGEYFKVFRKWFLNNVKIERIHIFESRDKTFNSEVLQETIILKAIKTKGKKSFIDISSSSDSRLCKEDINICKFMYDRVIEPNDHNLFIKIPTSKEDESILEFVDSWENNLLTLGYKLSTGPVVDFRATEYLSNDMNCTENMAPLFWPCHFQNDKVSWPNTATDKPQTIKVCDSSKQLLLNNSNYVFVKRFTTKEEKRRIQCSMYFGLEYNTEKIGVENHLNYIKKVSGILTEHEVYGIFTILNSTFVDRYFRILNGSTQVNANEMNSMPLPDKNAIIEIGYKSSKLLSLTPEICDRIICEYFNTDYIPQVV